ncbi:glycosyltransferase [Prochlorococcus sp. MIT 0916]|uniref:Glycosyltransferase n=1 Tax=Prochlorococcus marinus str. P0903-H212 TaxID=1622208 RepID=A0A0D5A415_PROMR|nr:Glycosyltransferase [Prochlorococcus marinus str. P0903-H212]
MRIVIDLQGIQSEGSRVRGIGRYSFEFIRNLIKFFPDNEYILFANSLLIDLRLEFKQELKIKNVNYVEWFSPAPFDYTSSDYIKSEIAKYLRTYTLSCLYADVIIITSFLEGFADNCLTDIQDIKNTKIVSIFYDLIPFLNPDLYLKNNPTFHKFYLKKINDLKRLDGLLAISKSSALEASKFLGFEKSKVFNISSACDQSIFNLGNNFDKSIKSLADQIRPFLLYTGAGDPRKNLKGLLKAYSMLSQELSNYKLVLVGKLLESEAILIDKWIDLYGINPQRIIKTGYISDEDLVDFYRKCELFIFPSFHEGFGLPVLEAMCCGAPVIGSNLTSISEVISFDKAMFDPYDANEMKELIEHAILDLNFRKELVINAKNQSDKFSWEITLKSTISALNQITNNNLFSRKLIALDTLKKENIKNFDILVTKIIKLTDFRFHVGDELLVQLSSSIDKINSQIFDFSRIYSSHEEPHSWMIEGPFDSNYSLAILNKFFFESLKKIIPNISLKITEGFGDYQLDINYLKRYPLIYQEHLLSGVNTYEPEIRSRNMYPPRVSDLDSRINLLHLYGWEESEFPSKWVDDFNTYLQGITVMSSLVKKILINNGVHIPIEVINLGLDHIDKIQFDPNFDIPGKKFKFLHISSGFPRKGIDILLKSFFDSFTEDDDVSLIIKTFDNPHNDIQEQIRELLLIHSSPPDVIIIKEDYNQIEIKSLILKSNVLVAPSRGEGFGLPIGEAMRLGIPVITTGWGGQIDFCNIDNCWLLDYKFVKSGSHFDLDLSYWAEPSSRHLSHLMRTFYTSKVHDISNRLSTAKEQTENLTWDLAAIKNTNFVNQKLNIYRNKCIKIGVVSTWFSRCGIASYTKHLVDNLTKDIHIFSPLYEDEKSNNYKHITPSWNASDKSKDLNLLYHQILSNNISTLIIQFNYGFYDFSQLSELIIKLKRNDINIIIIIHSCIDPKTDQTKKIETLYNAFSLCDRLIVHSIDDLNRLKKISLIENVCLIPHGILDFKYKKKRYLFDNLLCNKNNNVVATYGFCLPNKGYTELIKAIYLLKIKNLNIRLNIFSAIYSQDYFWYYQELVDLIEQLSLKKLVTINTKYMEDNETFEHLSNHDCLIFPYQSSTESSSASVRNALSTLRPVLVTPLEIFNDVSELVEYLPGFSPEDIATSLIDFFANKSYIINYKSEEFARKESIIKHRSFANVSHRILSLIEGIEYN